MLPKWCRLHRHKQAWLCVCVSVKTDRHDRAWVNARSNSNWQANTALNVDCSTACCKLQIASICCISRKLQQQQLTAATAIEMPDQPQSHCQSQPQLQLLSLSAVSSVFVSVSRFAPLHTCLIITDKTRLICKTDNSIGDQRSLQVRPQRRRTPRTHALKNYVNFLALVARLLLLNARGPC